MQKVQSLFKPNIQEVQMPTSHYLTLGIAAVFLATGASCSSSSQARIESGAQTDSSAAPVERDNNLERPAVVETTKPANETEFSHEPLNAPSHVARTPSRVKPVHEADKRKSPQSTHLAAQTLRRSESMTIFPGLHKPRGITQSLKTLPPAPASVSNSRPAAFFNTEEYDQVVDNEFRSPLDKPLSTFSIDVDAASYSNIRRFLTANSLPPKDAVRIEEMINYFTYEYPQPAGEHPFSITTELGACPWNQRHRLVHIGLQGRSMEPAALPPSNLVFLLDVSGSMNAPDKLPLLKKAMTLLVHNLRAQDRIAIAVYAGAAGLVLPPTAGNRKGVIIDAIERLRAGGSTAGSEGLQLAYSLARQHFHHEGNNRVILATDGDFNVGASSDAELVRMIEKKRAEGVFLTVLGFGTGNYKDAKMEKLADKGNGAYAYIDNVLEAKKALVTEMSGTLLTIAKDVKIQVEFNPEQVAQYRLIGYVNRALADEAFNDDTKDAGELGAGHTVTALYEIIPLRDGESAPARIDPLKYQRRPVRTKKAGTDELLTVKFRYKNPAENVSALHVEVLRTRRLKEESANFRLSAAVAGFGMLLRNSEHKNDLTYAQVLALARGARGDDSSGYRAELIQLIERAQILDSRVAAE